MPAPDVITDPFSERRRSLLEDFANVTGSHDAQKILATWSDYGDALAGARGIFVVEDPKHSLCLPGDRDFGGKGFLRCLMGSTTLLNIQSSEKARDSRYSGPIFCDTNFVSFCGAHYAGRDLGANAHAFKEAVTFLLPIANNLNATAYTMENAENQDTDKVRGSLIGFTAMTRTSVEDFERDQTFTRNGEDEVTRIVDEFLETLRGSDFRTLYEWVKERHIWARVILLKSTLIAFSSCNNVDGRMRDLSHFLHEECARFPQFGIYVAFRFFSLNAQEPFFSSVQQNASALDRTLNAMAWDLAHWTTLFDLTNMFSSMPPTTAFPVPHFLSFDRRFIRLAETFKLDGIIYAAKGKRCEQFYSRELLRAVSNLLEGPLGEFHTAAAIADRRRRIAGDAQRYDARLLELEVELTQQLTEFCDKKF